MSVPKHDFTLKFPGLSRIIVTPLAIALPTSGIIPNPKYQTRCIWDTGCSNTTITQAVVDALGLKPTGVATVNTASETNKTTVTYQIDLFLSDTLCYRNMTVNLGVIISGIDCLLGMDVIGTGDFSITGLDGKTCMSFRFPSLHEIDFSTNPNYGIQEIRYTTPEAKNNYAGTPRNVECPCQSGKKYKHCHGKTA